MRARVSIQYEIFSCFTNACRQSHVDAHATHARKCCQYPLRALPIIFSWTVAAAAASEQPPTMVLCHSVCCICIVLPPFSNLNSPGLYTSAIANARARSRKEQRQIKLSYQIPFTPSLSAQNAKARACKQAPESRARGRSYGGRHNVAKCVLQHSGGASRTQNIIRSHSKCISPPCGCTA